MRLSDIKAWHDALPIYGGTLVLPAEQIDGTDGEEVVITKSNVRIVGQGMNMHDAQEANTTVAYRAPTQIKYTGTGIPIQIGTPAQTAPTLGTELKGFSLRGTDAALGGIKVNVGAGGFVSGRILIEDVDVRDFKNPTACAGIDINWGVDVKLRRVHAHNNHRGIWVKWGTALDFESCVVRHNWQGYYLAAFMGLSMRGRGVVESNDYSGILVNMEDNCSDLVIKEQHIENNNIISSGINNAVHVRAAVAGCKLSLFRMENMRFDGGRGDFGYDAGTLDYQEVHQIRWNNGTYTA